jgi:hypothetical protein
MKVAVIIVLIVLAVLLGPCVLLWSLNTLSEQAHLGWYIPHNLWTYLAGFALLGVANGR